MTPIRKWCTIRQFSADTKAEEAEEIEMQIAANCPREPISVGGMSNLQMPIPITEGHKCVVNEAHALNQLLKENARNNLRERIKKCVEDGGKLAECQKVLDEYLAAYEFGKAGGGGGRETDPIRAEALDQAKKLIRRALIKKGTKLSTVSAADMTKKANALVERRPELLKNAAKTVANRDRDMEGVLDDVA